MGHLRKRADGCWDLIAESPRDPLTGKRRQVSRRFLGSERAANRALVDLMAQVGANPGSSATVSQLLDRWLELVGGTLSPTTLRTYQGYINRRIRPALGQRRLEKLGTDDLDAFYKALSDEGLAPASVRQVHAILRRALNQGVRWGWITTNPALLTTKPPNRRRQRPAPTPVEVLALVAAGGPSFSAMFRLAAATGARRGELCALRWPDVDLERGSVDIARAVISAPGRWIEKGTKTHASRRNALDPETVAVLADWRASCEKRAAEAGVELTAEAFVFSPAFDGSRPWSPDRVSHAFIEARDALGLVGVRLHDLRHAHGTALIGAGIDVRAVANRLGHAQTSTTLNVYAHAIEARDRDAADVAGRLLSP